jgi:hypothetical protein
LEFTPGVTVEEVNEPNLNAGHTAIDMNGDQHVGSSSDAPVEQEDEEKKYRGLVDAAMAVLFPNGEGASRRIYSPEEIKYLIEMHFVKRQAVAEIMETSEINISTARGYIRDVRHIFESVSSGAVNDTHKTLINVQQMDNSTSPSRPVVAPAPRGNQKLCQEHSRYLVDFFERNQLATLEMAREALLKTFNLSVSRSGINQHMRKKGCLVVKCLEALKPVSATEEKQEVSISNGGVFVGAVDLLMYVRTSFGWRRGEPLSAIHSGIIVPALAAISDAGLVNLSVVAPVCVLQNSKGCTKTVVERKIDVYAKFFAKCMNIMERKQYLGKTIVTNDDDIFCNQSVKDMFEDRGFKLVLKRPISFENFWLKFKDEVCRQELKTTDPLIPRLCLASQAITIEDCQQFMQQNSDYE